MFLELKKQGWQCIPLIPASKKPIEKLDRLGRFTGIHQDGIPDDICKEWDKKYSLKNCGLGIITGKSSNVSVLDLDTDCEDILDVIPYSPLVKKGLHLGTYFYQHFTEYDKSKDKFGAQELEDFVELLARNALCVLPPTLHPRTKKPFIWSGQIKSLLNYSPDMLPVLTFADIENIKRHYANKYKNNEDASQSLFSPSKSVVTGLNDFHEATFENGSPRCANGSHDRIKAKAALLIADHTPIELAIKELVRYDMEHHLGVPYFQDKGRGLDAKEKDPHLNALRFYTSLLSSINQQRSARGEDAISIVRQTAPEEKTQTEEIRISEKTKEQTTKKELPAITGMMKVFVDYLNRYSISENTEVYLGASLAWLSMLVASRFAVNTKAFTTPANLMIWGVLPSGVGKDSPQKLIQDLLYSHGVLGAGSYKSAPSLLMNLKNVFKDKGQKQELLRKAQRENLMMIDECSSLFRLMAKGESYQQDMVETLNTLFSRSSGFFAGDQSVDRGIKYGAAYNPYFTLLGFTTFNHFENITGGKIVGNGFFERSLVFIETKKNPFNKNPFKDDEAFKKLKEFTDAHLKTPINLVDFGEYVLPENEITTEVAYTDFPIQEDAEKFLHDYREKMYEANAEEIDVSFFNRFGELATKLSLLHSISDGRSEIEVSDIEWGAQVVEWCHERARKVFLKIQNEEDVYARAMDKIQKAINAKPDKKISRTELTTKVRFEPKNSKRGRFLTELLEMNFLTHEEIGGKQWISLV